MMRWVFVLLMLAGCAPARPVPPVVSTQSPTDAFVHYWENRLAESADPATWRDLCAAVDRWPALQPPHIARLDDAMSQWPDELRVPPDRWHPIDDPAPLPVWPLIRAVELGPGDEEALTTALPQLDRVTTIWVDGPGSLSALATAAGLPSVTDVRVSGADLPSVQALVSARGHELVTLDLWENNLGPGLGAIVTSRRWAALEQLDIGANRLDEDAAKQLARLEAPKVHTLGISFNTLGDDGFAAITGARLNLVELEARATGIGIASVKALAQLDISKLEALDLSDNELGDAAITDLSTLPLEQLRALRLNRVGVTERGLLALSGVLGGGLEVLELGRNDLGDEGVAPLCTPGAAGLRFLQLDSVRLTDASAKLIARCPHLSGLRSLSLHANGDLSVAGMTDLAAARFEDLTALGLDNCTIRDDGLEALVGARWWPQLTHLRIEANGFTDASAAVLADLPQAIENLGLGWNELGAASAKQLATLELPQLRELSLRGSAFDAPALRALAEARWLQQLDELDLRALPYDGLGPALDTVAAHLPEHAILRREQ